jgi:hypothetical protein
MTDQDESHKEQTPHEEPSQEENLPERPDPMLVSDVEADRHPLPTDADAELRVWISEGDSSDRDIISD